MSYTDHIEQVLEVKIFSPRTVYFDGQAIRLSAKNDTGTFDILPLHHSFITLLNAGVVTIATTSNEERSFEIDKGLLRLKNNRVVVFIDV